MRKGGDDRRVDKLRAGLHRTETAAETAEHTYFDDGGAARGARSARRRARGAARPRRPDKAARVAGKRVRRAYASLDSALDDQRASTDLLQRLEAEKHVLRAKGRKRKVAGAAHGRAAVFKWKKCRQK